MHHFGAGHSSVGETNLSVFLVGQGGQGGQGIHGIIFSVDVATSAALTKPYTASIRSGSTYQVILG